MKIYLLIFCFLMMVPQSVFADAKINGFLTIEEGGGITFKDGTLNSAQGITGPIGPQGAKGDTGPQGPPGSPGQVTLSTICSAISTGNAAIPDFCNNVVGTISGSVKNSSNQAIPGAMVGIIGNNVARTATTDLNGNYTFNGLLNGSYTLSSALETYSFTPSNIPVSLYNNCSFGNNFTGTQTYLSVAITGLTGSGLVLQNNGSNNTPVPAGATSVQVPISGSNYNVSIFTYPSTPLQTCTVSDGVGTLGQGASNISIACSNPSGIAYLLNKLTMNTEAHLINADNGSFAKIGDVLSGNGAAYGVVHPSGKFLYAPFSSNIFSINSNTAALNLVGTYATGSSPTSIAFDPTGKFAYVTNYGSNNVSAYTVNTSTGVLTPISTYTAGTSPYSVDVDPTGKFAYVVNSGSNNISAYSINSITGALSAIGTYTTGGSPQQVKVDPTGKFVYSANYTSNNVSAFSINASTGALTLINTYTVESRPWSISFDPTGKYMYVGNSLSSSYSMFSVNSVSGALTGGGTMPSDGQPYSIYFDRTGAFAYAGSSNNYRLHLYTLNVSTGALNDLGSIVDNVYGMMSIKTLP